MKSISLLFASVLLVGVTLSGCDNGAHTPTLEDLSGVSWDDLESQNRSLTSAQKKKLKTFGKKLKTRVKCLLGCWSELWNCRKSCPKGWKGKTCKKQCWSARRSCAQVCWMGQNQCTTVNPDPLADMMPASHLKEDFEKHPVGDADVLYRWLEAPGAKIEVVKEKGTSKGKGFLKGFFKGNRMLKIVSAGDVTTGYDGVAAKFCVRCEAMKRFRVEFAIKFDSFVDYTGFSITNSPNLAYWWWVRSDGTIFDATTFDTFQPGKWHKVRIDIDRGKNEARMTIDGTVHEVDLDPTWPAFAQSQPMGCFRVLLMEYGGQTLYLDNIRVHAIQ